MYVVIYTQAKNNPIDDDTLAINLKRAAEAMGWYVKQTFLEKAAIHSSSDAGTELQSLLDYAAKTQVDAVVISDLSYLGHHVEDVKRSVELLHERGIALYLHPFKVLTFENGRENPITQLLLHSMLMGAAMERNHRHTKQMAGIKRARQNGAFPGRRQGATTKPETLLSKYSNVAQLIDQGELSIRAIAKTTHRSINTVRKVKALKG